MVIQGFLHDIQPRQARPTLELYFDTKDRSSFPRGERVPIVLELEGICLSGTMNSANSNNPPYVHTNLTLSNGTRRSCTELFLGLGLAEKARLEFELTNLNNLRLRRTIDRGGWRPGGAPDERIAGAIASDTRSAKSRLPQASPSISTPFPFDDRDEILKLAELYWNQISDGEAARRARIRRRDASCEKGWLYSPNPYLCAWEDGNRCVRRPTSRRTMRQTSALRPREHSPQLMLEVLSRPDAAPRSSTAHSLGPVALDAP